MVKKCGGAAGWVFANTALPVVEVERVGDRNVATVHACRPFDARPERVLQCAAQRVVHG